MTQASKRTFLVVWFGQAVSLIGTSLTGFALAVFVFQETGSATQLSLILLASQLPRVVFTPFAGALVDRWDRRWAMMLSDAGAGAATAIILILLAADSLEIIYLYPILAMQGVFQTFQFPAYSAATTLLVDRDDYGRAAGLVQLAEAGSQVAAPAIAATLLVAGGLVTVVAVDVATFLVALATLTAVRFPAPEPTLEGDPQGSLWSEVRFGGAYLRDRPGLIALLGYFAVLNLIFGFIGVLFFPLVLGFASEQATGWVLSIGAVGMVVGSLVMSAWGGPARRLHGVVFGAAGLSVALVVVGIRPSLGLVAVAAFIGLGVTPIANGSSQAIWQAKVAPEIQGRVFALRTTVAQIAAPISLVAAGPLLDSVFDPALAPGGTLAGSVGRVIGTGPGRGAGFMFILLGTIGIVASLAAFAYPRLRNLETELPDAVPPDEGVEA